MSIMPLQDKQDSSKLKETKTDPAVKLQTDGDYVYTRPRNMVLPKSEITTGFTNLTEADKVTMESFWDEVRGGSYAFSYTHPIKKTELQVRFQDVLNFNFTGIGLTNRWDLEVRLKEV